MYSSNVEAVAQLILVAGISDAVVAREAFDALHILLAERRPVLGAFPASFTERKKWSQAMSEWWKTEQDAWRPPKQGEINRRRYRRHSESMVQMRKKSAMIEKAQIESVTPMCLDKPDLKKLTEMLAGTLAASNSEDFVVQRRNAILATRNTPSAKVIPLLATVARHPSEDAYNRVKAVRAIAAAPGAEAFGELVGLITNRTLSVARTALEVLENMTGHTCGPLVVAMEAELAAKQRHLAAEWQAWGEENAETVVGLGRSQSSFRR